MGYTYPEPPSTVSFVVTSRRAMGGCGVSFGKFAYEALHIL